MGVKLGTHIGAYKINMCKTGHTQPGAYKTTYVQNLIQTSWVGRNLTTLNLMSEKLNTC